MKIYDSDGISYNIEVPAGNGEFTSTCPACSKDRKKKDDKCFSWNRDKDVGKCHHCERHFKFLKAKKEYVRPEWKNNTELSDGVVKFFEKRGIKQFTLRAMKITEGKEWMPGPNKLMNTIQFNYFRDGELVNIKYRDGNKDFKMFKDAELIFYNIDAIKETEEVVIVEGEIDALTLYECGIHNVVSVPNGAGSSNMEYLDNCIDYFENKTKIILATDDDIPGVKLRTTLAHRLGVERCYKVKFKGENDPNDMLVVHGKDALINAINDAVEFPVDGIVTVNDLLDEVNVLYQEGMKPGLQIGVPEFDHLISFEKNRLLTLSGIPMHGKSEFLDFLLMKLNIMHGWKVGYFSPENFPVPIHVSKLVSKISGCKFDTEHLDPGLYRHSLEYINDNFFFVRPEEDYKLETVLARAKYLVSKKGIDAFVIDPYNKLEHQFKGGESETSYVSRFLDMILNFAHRNNVLMILVAHPRKMNKREDGSFEVPSLYDISGSANFYNKTDYGMSVYRSMEKTDDGMQYSNKTEVHIQKVKFKHLGGPGMCRFAYDAGSGRYAYFDGQDVNNIHYDKSSWMIKQAIKLQYNDDITETISEAPF